jgi:hypothetical protein
MKKKVKLLSDHDVREVAKFQKYIEDMRSMPLANFYARYQEYMGLSDSELAAVIRREMTKGELDRAIRRAHNIFDKWNDCTGVIGVESSYYYEFLGVIDDAVHCGAQAATGDYRQLSDEEPKPPYCKAFVGEGLNGKV